MTTCPQCRNEIVRGEDREILAIGGGFMEVRGPQVVVMADVAEHAEEIDLARAEQARARAEEALREAPRAEDMAEALAALRRAAVRIQVAKRVRRTHHQRPGGAGSEGGEA